MSLLSRNQRAVICADTSIHPLIVDRACDAFDALIEREDREAYRQLMATAWSQMGYDATHPVKDKDRPTPLDRMKTILIKAYADREHIPYLRARRRLERMLHG